MIKRPMINDALRLVRLYWGFSQVELAERLGVSQSVISEIEGKKKDASLDLVERYSDVLEIKLSQLLFFAEQINGKPIASRGRLVVAEYALRLLEKLKPGDRSAA